MEKNILTKEIKSVIAEVIDMDESSFTNTQSFIEDLGVDSLKALAVLAALEKKYRIEIDEEHLLELTNVEKTVDLTYKILQESA